MKHKIFFFFLIVNIICFSSLNAQESYLDEFLENSQSRASYDKDKTLLITLKSNQPNVFQELYSFEEFIEEVIDAENPDLYDEDNLDPFYDYFETWFDENYSRIRVCSLESENCETTTSLAGFMAFYPFFTANLPANSRLQQLENEERANKAVKIMLELKNVFFDTSDAATKDLYSVEMEAKNLFSESDHRFTMLEYYGYYLTFNPSNLNFLTLYNKFYKEEYKTQFETGREVGMNELESQQVTEEYFEKSSTNGRTPLFKIVYKNSSEMEDFVNVLTPGFTSNKFQIKNTHYERKGDIIHVTEYDYVEFAEKDFDKMNAVYLANSDNGFLRFSRKIPNKSIFTNYLNKGDVKNTFKVSMAAGSKFCVEDSYLESSFEVLNNFNYNCTSYDNDFFNLRSVEVFTKNCKPQKLIIKNNNGKTQILNIDNFIYDVSWNNKELTEEQKNEIRKKLGYPTKN